MIWSDREIQEFSRKFVCVMDDVFYLKPPANVSKTANPASVKYFSSFIQSTPKQVWPTETKTHQGLYIMTPECKYLAGKFASQSNTNARQILNDGWAKWANRPQALGSSTVPLDYTPVVGGLPISDKRIKLRISYRDLPRGHQQRPGNSDFVNPYNMGWFDISTKELRGLFTKDNAAVFKKIALAAFKDAVRGEMYSWNSDDWQGGELTARWFRQDGQIAFYYLEGHARLARKDTALTYSPRVFGFVGYDFDSQKFRDLQLVAMGQRSGKGPSNGRDSDLGPAPLGVALRMHHPGH